MAKRDRFTKEVEAAFNTPSMRKLLAKARRGTAQPANVEAFLQAEGILKRPQSVRRPKQRKSLPGQQSLFS